MRRPRIWAFWRRLQYALGFLTFLTVLFTTSYFVYLYAPATCFDGVQNGIESGKDCGGSCVRICAFSVTPPKVVWAESFKIVDGQYNAVAYIENSNTVAASPAMSYTFRLVENGSVIAERKGITILPPNSVYPVFEGRIFTADDREPTETTIEIEPIDMWLPASVGRDQFKTLETSLLSADSRPRLNVQVENTQLTEARDVEVVATIFDNAGKPLTASQTKIDVFGPRSKKDIVFTWPNSIAKTVRSCDVPSDIVLVLDRSGSMAADGGDPPEPLESAKTAAVNFLKQIKTNDLVGFLSYATNPSSPIEQSLTSNIVEIEKTIKTTKMGEDGIQYTNMGEAFSSALNELTSERHREDARKVIIFLTDGDVTRPVNPQTGLTDRDYASTYAKNEAEKAKTANVTIYTIGFGEYFNGEDEEVKRDVELIKDLASEPALYFEAPNVAQLLEVYKKIAGNICETGATRIEIIPKTSANFAPLR